jgi:hypothetical protein
VATVEIPQETVWPLQVIDCAEQYLHTGQVNTVPAEQQFEIIHH